MRISEEAALQTFAGLFASATATEIVSALPPSGWSTHNFLTRAADIGSVADALLQHPAGAGATGVWAVAWAITRPATVGAWVARFPDAGGVRLLMDSFQLERRRGAVKETPLLQVVRLAGGWQSDRLRSGAVHAKVARLRGTALTVIGSGNVEGGPKRIEAVSISADPTWAAAVDEWFNIIWDGTLPLASGQLREPTPDQLRIGDRQLRRAHDLACATSPAGPGIRLGVGGGPSPAPAAPDDASGKRKRPRPPSGVEIARRGRTMIDLQMGGVPDAAAAAAVDRWMAAAQRAERLSGGYERRKLKADALISETELAKLRGELLPREEVIERWAEELIQVRDAFLAIPDRARLQTFEHPSDAIDYVDEDIRRVLNTLSKHPPGVPLPEDAGDAEGDHD